MNKNDYQDFVEGYTRLTRAKQAAIHMIIFRFEVKHFRESPSLDTFRGMWDTFRILTLPDAIYFATPPALVLASICLWAWAMATHNPLLWLACICLAAAAWMKRPKTEKRNSEEQP